MADDKLTDKQEQFCQEYLIDLNASAAARRAGYAEGSADVEGSRLLGNAKVAARVAELQAERSKRTQITADKVLQELAVVGFGRLANIIRVDGNGLPVIDLSSATPDEMAIIASVKTKEYQEGRGDDAETILQAEIKQHDKLKALELIGKHLGIWVDKVEHSGEVKSEVHVMTLPDNGRGPSKD